MEKQIEHEGTVTSIDDHTMVVRIVASSACNSCAAKSHCIPSENKDKDILIKNFSGDFILGERVKVVMQQSLGFKALAIGYMIPLFLFLLILVMVNQITNNELMSGICALGVLVPYYISVKLFDHKIEKTFGFQVKKFN